ncbi:MAG: hypothetical protein HDS66_03490 [Bacteroidales bacterium]|nr:hypothetical protein [Bacteroidales bacterium]
MATFNTTPSEETYEIKDYEEVANDTATEDPIPLTDATEGMTMKEINDANKIKVTIADKTTPIVVLFGPPSCGKTMTLIRLARFLKSLGYTIEPDASFRPAYDANYKRLCEGFNDMLNSDNAAYNTANINFMLVKVLKDGRPICQILEGPGELYFNPGVPTAEFPRYVKAIKNSNNKKIWVVMVEPNDTNPVMDGERRRHYADKVSELKSNLDTKDKVIFLFNKIDKTHFVHSPGNIKYGLAMQYIAQHYENLFQKYINENPITKIWRKYNFDFIGFQTGDYSTASDGVKTFEEGNDVYPRNLWNIILKRTRG